MRGCALPLTRLPVPPSHFSNGIINNNIAATHSLTVPSPKPSLFFLSNTHKPNTTIAQFSSSAPNSVDNFQVLTALKTDYNDILIVDTPNSRMLLLDSSHCVHSILYKEQKWTGSYWDEFASLPAIVPKGPIAILGWWNCCSSDA